MISIRFTIALLFLSTLSFAETASHGPAAKQPAPGRFSAPATGFNFQIPTTGQNIPEQNTPEKVEELDPEVWDAISCKMVGDFSECIYKHKITGEEKLVRKPKPGIRKNSTEVKAPVEVPVASAATHREITSADHLAESMEADGKAGAEIILLTFGRPLGGGCPPCDALHATTSRLAGKIPNVSFYHVNPNVQEVWDLYRKGFIKGNSIPESVVLQKKSDGSFVVLPQSKYNAGNPSGTEYSFIGAKSDAKLTQALTDLLK